MTNLWIFIALFVFVGLVLIWFPHFRQQKMRQTEQAGVRKQANLVLFKQRQATLEQELADGLLEQKEFAALKQELEISLLQDVSQNQDESLVNQVKHKGLLWPVLMSIVMIGISGYFYNRLGAYAYLDKTVSATQQAKMSGDQLLAQQINMMEAKLKSRPDDTQLLFSLANRYIGAGRYDEAVKLFDKLTTLVGPSAEVLGPKATALYYKANQHMTTQVQALIKQSLALDPQDPSTLLLVGMEAFFSADYSKAIGTWQTILDSDRSGIDRSAIINAIDTAKMRLGDKAATPNDTTHRPLATKSSVIINISVASELKNKVNADDTLFVFALNTNNGSRIPLAVVKVPTASLPTSITLDDSTNMGGTARLSDAKTVEVIAVLSKHGNAKPQNGDIEGRVSQVKVGDTIQLELNKLIK